jgi:hypothetical protein
MTEQVLKRVEELGTNEKITSYQDKLFLFEWAPKEPITNNHITLPDEELETEIDLPAIPLKEIKNQGADEGTTNQGAHRESKKKHTCKIMIPKLTPMLG